MRSFSTAAMFLVLLAGCFFVPLYSSGQVSLPIVGKADTLAAPHRAQPDHIVNCSNKSRLVTYSNQSTSGVGRNYDLKEVRLELDVDPDSPVISGNVTHHFTALDNINQITLDLASNMNVTSIVQRGAPLTFSHNTSDALIIDLPNVQNTGVLDSLTVHYNGNPISSGFGSFAQTTHNNHGIIWTLSEPYGAQAWWPTKQDLNDKIDRTVVELNVPAGNMGVSNGLLTSQTNSTNGIRYRWVHNYRIPAYLIAIAVTNYVKYTDVVTTGPTVLNIDNYVYPENLATAQSQTQVTIPIMQFFENEYGDYPFRNEKYGHAQFGWGGGMEHTTISFMGNFSRGLIAHELAHQWFGNKVTCGSWQDIWLNEGFATYASGRTVDHLDGAGAFTSWRRQTNNLATSRTDGSVYVPAQDTLSVGRVFNYNLTYNKSAMVLHMLRNKLGATTYNSVLRAYLSDPLLDFDYARTTDFKRVAEQVSGEDLTEFFGDWIYGQGYPTHNLQWVQDTAGNLAVTFNQTSSHSSVGFFEVELPIRVHGTGGQVLDLAYNLMSPGQIESLSPGFRVDRIEVDPDVHTISRNNTSTLGIESAFAKAELTLYPNPTTGNFTIETDGIVNEIIIYDTLGRIVTTLEPRQPTVVVEAVLSPGTYLVETVMHNRRAVKKLIIE